jgi:hypothetical protein
MDISEASQLSMVKLHRLAGGLTGGLGALRRRAAGIWSNENMAQLQYSR